jgi:hypothetical protein
VASNEATIEIRDVIGVVIDDDEIAVFEFEIGRNVRKCIADCTGAENVGGRQNAARRRRPWV